MKRKSSFANLLLAAFMAVSVILAGCSGSAPDPGSTGAGEEAGMPQGDGTAENPKSDGKDEGSSESVSDDPDNSGSADTTAKETPALSMECINQHMNMKSGDYISADGICYSFVLDDASIGAYPDFAKKIEGINEKAYSDFCESLESASAGSIQRHMDGWEYPYDVDRKAMVTRLDGKAFSYGVQNYSYLGGAHGYTFYSAANIDPQTGEDIVFWSVVTDVSDFPQIVLDELTTQNPDMKGYFDDLETDRQNFLDRIANNVKRSGDGPVWSLSYDGIKLYFEDYAMGSYAAGSQVVDVLYKDHPEIFNSDYFEFGQDTPSVEDNVTTKDIEEAVTVESSSSVMQVGFAVDYMYHETGTYCIGGVDKLAIPDEYPELKKTMDEINSENESRLRSGFQDFTDRMTEEASKKMDGPGFSGRACTHQIHQYVTRADSKVFSTVEAREEVGISENSRVLVGINLDPSTGEEISLDKVTKDLDALKDAIDDVLNEEGYPDATVKQVSEEMRRQIDSGNITSNEKLSFTIGYEGLTFYCNNTINYSLMDFSNDGVPLFIPYYGHEDLFEKDYTKAPVTFACQIPLSGAFGTGVYMDTGYDKNYKGVRLYPVMDDYGTVSGLTISLNSFLNKVEDFYAYDVSATYVKSPDGDCYIYVQCGLDDGYSLLRIFNLSFDTFSEEKDRETYYAVNYGTVSDDEKYRGYVMTDPLNFRVLATDDVLGARDIYADCCIDSLGYPVPRDGVWYYNEGEGYEIIPLDDISTDSGTMKKGDKIMPFCIGPAATDEGEPGGTVGNETEKNRILTLKDSSGREYVLETEFDAKEWVWKYKGKNIKEYFDGNFNLYG